MTATSACKSSACRTSPSEKSRGRTFQEHDAEGERGLSVQKARVSGATPLPGYGDWPHTASAVVDAEGTPHAPQAEPVSADGVE